MKRFALLVVAAFLTFTATPVHAEESLSPSAIDPAVARFLDWHYGYSATTATWRFLGAAEWEVEVSQCLARFESHQTWWKRSYQMNANGTWDHGYFQVNDFWWGPYGGLVRLGYPQLGLADRYDPYINAAASWVIYQRGGWKQWTTASRCGV